MFGSRFGLCLAALMLSGCAGIVEPSIPGLKNNVTLPDPVKVEHVLVAVKCQIGKAVKKVNASERKIRKPGAKRVEFYTGSLTFSGTVQVANENGVTIAAVIPFTGYADSTLGPDIGASLGNTVLENVTQTYSVNPKSADKSDCTTGVVGGLDHGDFLFDSIYSFYTQLIAENSGEKPGVTITPTNLKIKTTLQIVQKVNGGVATIITFGNPALTSLTGPGITGDFVRTGLFELTVDLPLNASKPTEDRRLVYCDFNSDSEKSLCVEEIFEFERYKKLFSALESSERFGRFPSETDAEGNRNTLSLDQQNGPHRPQIQAESGLAEENSERSGLQQLFKYVGPQRGAPAF